MTARRRFRYGPGSLRLNSKRAGFAADAGATVELGRASAPLSKSAAARRAEVMPHVRSRTIRFESEPSNVASFASRVFAGLYQSTASTMPGCSFRKPRICPSTIGRMTFSSGVIAAPHTCQPRPRSQSRALCKSGETLQVRRYLGGTGRDFVLGRRVGNSMQPLISIEENTGGSVRLALHLCHFGHPIAHYVGVQFCTHWNASKQSSGGCNDQRDFVPEPSCAGLGGFGLGRAPGVRFRQRLERHGLDAALAGRPDKRRPPFRRDAIALRPFPHSEEGCARVV